VESVVSATTFYQMVRQQMLAWRMAKGTAANLKTHCTSFPAIISAIFADASGPPAPHEAKRVSISH
jgi:hypothetical protein